MKINIIDNVAIDPSILTRLKTLAEDVHGDIQFEDVKELDAIIKELGEHRFIDTESLAMLQAIYSRSTTSMEEHIGSKTSEELKASMAKFYLGYGHKSIADTASTTISIEGVSMLVAKAIQSYFAYSGQESSTRYIDFRDMGVYVEGDSSAERTVPNKLLDLYDIIVAEKYKELKENFSCPDGTKEEVWDKTLKARAFDVARGWLPCGAKTNLSWHTNLRQLGDRLEELRHHPLAEVRKVAVIIKEQAIERYPSSFQEKFYPATDEYYEANALAFHYSHLSILEGSGKFNFEAIADENNVHMMDSLEPIPDAFEPLIINRPKFARLPRELSVLGEMNITFPLDFASFRDLHRHRSATISNVIVYPFAGMHNWYYDQLPGSISNDVIAKTQNILNEIRDEINSGNNTAINMQYLCPMGCKVATNMCVDIPSLVYILELRSSNTVHQTLRNVISVIAQNIRLKYGNLTLHMDESGDELDPRRGTQDLQVTPEPMQGVEVKHTNIKFEVGEGGSVLPIHTSGDVNRYSSEEIIKVIGKVEDYDGLPELEVEDGNIDAILSISEDGDVISQAITDQLVEPKKAYLREGVSTLGGSVAWEEWKQM